MNQHRDRDQEIISEALPERLLMRQIADTVRKIGWSYAFFWNQISTKQPGALEWSAGYYNGRIKTRKTAQPVELDPDQMQLQRSEQLRELYESLASGDCTKRPCASLSPEDLTDAEWYYLICMSFTFFLGQGLPGKAFAEDQYIWLNISTLADPTIFSRSLLAKGAGIETIVCISVKGGVLELGTTERVIDDPNLVVRITSFFLEIPNPVCTEKSIHSPMMANNEAGILCPNTDTNADKSIIIDMEEQNSIIDRLTLIESSGATNISSTTEKVNEPNANIFEELNLGSFEDSSNEHCPIQQLEDLLGIVGLNSMSGAQNSQPIDDGVSNVLYDSFNSNLDVSTSFSNAQIRIRDTMLENLQGEDHNKLISFDLSSENSHYRNTVAMILQNLELTSHVLCSLKASCNSHFIGWREDFNTQKPLTSMSQKLLKKILIYRSWFEGGHQIKKNQEEKILKEKVSYPEGEYGACHMLSERRRREKLNEKFLALRSLVPSINKIDKISVLGDTIEYIKELQRKVQHLETYKQSVELDTRDYKKKHPEAAERRLDIHYNKETVSRSKKPSENKRKACEIDGEHHWVLSGGRTIAVNATMKMKEVLVEVHCPWRECLIFEIFESIRELHLDPLTVQSFTTNGILALIIKSKCRSYAATTPGMIKGSLERVIGNL